MAQSKEYKIVHITKKVPVLGTEDVEIDEHEVELYVLNEETQLWIHVITSKESLTITNLLANLLSGHCFIGEP